MDSRVRVPEGSNNKGATEVMKGLNHCAQLQRTLEEFSSDKSGDHMHVIRCMISKAS